MKTQKIQKTARIDSGTITDEELAKINQFALAPLTAEQVFTFKAVLCDNEVDRTFERFSDESLEKLSSLIVGKTVIKNHTPDADNQVARIYSAEVTDTGQLTSYGEPYRQLTAHCYMVRTAGNTDMIAEISGGIRKEGSISCSLNSRKCSICGKDSFKEYCSHRMGKVYEGRQCCFILDGIADAYEFSLVAIPAQRNAGISKSYEDETEKINELQQRLRLLLLHSRK
ncbi:MAG: hypothetical protein IKP69_05335 [Oscillospiraceae bacterium]|nr:hypothetical protein [Oscillospiraceae bacterium]